MRRSAALTAALACVAVFALGAWGLRQLVYHELMTAARTNAWSELDQLADVYRSVPGTGGPADPASMAGLNGDAMFEVVTDSQQVVARSDNLLRLDPAWSGLAPAPADAAPDWTTITTTILRPGEHPHWREYRTYDVVGMVLDVPVRSMQSTDGDAGGTRRLTLYVFVLPWDAMNATRAFDDSLKVFLPLAVLFVAVVAWYATGRALRPVEAIRREMAEVSVHQLDRRVPVPRSGDEIEKLARTTNATLDRLERAHRRQQQFVADASHELRSPLASLRTGLEVALAHPDRVDWPRTAQRSLLDVQRLQDLTADLLLLASHDATAVPETLVDLAALAWEQVAERQRDSGHRPTADGTADGPGFRCVTDGAALVRGNSGQLDRLLRNLLDNAARHARTTVTVTVRTDDPPGGDPAVVLEVHDDGSGIPVAERQRVFERFTRLDDARARDSGGSGLGLTIARDVAQRHGGTLLVVDSDVGALLVTRLPLVDDTPAKGRGEEQPVEAA
ncbi:hypothetical protein GCM10027290_00340 [Micromonospora sonneratiae]|uniref:histidine kinase n=1 Tax=Micromonospora sonneratiae TaxID=1184706 RepID=A0ABW3Y7P3_9ACTN